MNEMEGQMSLFTMDLDGADEWIQWHYADEGSEEEEHGCPLCPRGTPKGQHADPA